MESVAHHELHRGGMVDVIDVPIYCEDGRIYADCGEDLEDLE